MDGNEWTMYVIWRMNALKMEKVSREFEDFNS